MSSGGQKKLGALKQRGGKYGRLARGFFLEICTLGAKREAPKKIWLLFL